MEETINNFESFVKKAGVFWHLILPQFDEMKLETGVFWRTSNHAVCGFASSNQNSTIGSVLSYMVQNVDNST
jgi:hypothetical protein